MTTRAGARAAGSGSSAGKAVEPTGSLAAAAAGAAPAAASASGRSVNPPAAGEPSDAAADIAAEVLKQFRIIFRSVKKHFLAIERKCGIGGSQLWALAAIVERPGLRVSDLGRALSVHQSTASNLVEQMVRLGLIQRERDEEDQRVVHLKATPRGVALLARAPQPLIGLLPDALSQLDAQNLAGLHEQLGRLLSVMQSRDEGATHTPLADI